MKKSDKKNPPVNWDDKDQVARYKRNQGRKIRYKQWLKEQDDKALNKIPNCLRLYF